MEEEKNGCVRALWAVCLVPLLIGIILLSCASSRTEYSTDEYWVAKDYNHVYRKSSGQIVDNIEENEVCEIRGDVIVVTERRQPMYLIGGIITGLFSCLTGALIITEISYTEWWKRICDVFRDTFDS